MTTNITQQFNKFLTENNIDVNEKFVLAISTGIDSMALLNLFMPYKTQIIVAHVNHNKREQSIIEEEFIKDYCMKHNIICEVTTLSYQEKANFQSYARKLRYQFFNGVATKYQAKYLVLAHHLDDNAETMIMKMMRMSSLRSKAMKERYKKEIEIIRPLLKVTKKDIIEYVQTNEITYFEDSTNNEDTYTRNKIRHNILAPLKEIYPNALNKMQEFSDELTEIDEIINDLTTTFIDQNIKTSNHQYTFNIETFLKLKTYLQREVLFTLLQEHNFSKANINEIIKIISSQKQNIITTFKDKIIIIKEYVELHIYDMRYYHKQQFSPLECEIKIDGTGIYQINDNIKINVTKKKDIIVTKSNELWYNSIKLPITIRTRQPKDKIKVGNGYKKVKDLLIDAKVGIIKRNKTLLAVDQNGEVLIVFNVKKSSLLSLKDEANDILITVEEDNNG